MAGVGLIPPRQLFENVHQVVGQRRRKFHPMSVTRMRDREPLRMQERPTQTLHRAKISGDTPVHTSVHRIADDGVSDCAEMGRESGESCRCGSQPGTMSRPGDGVRVIRVTASLARLARADIFCR